MIKMPLVGFAGILGHRWAGRRMCSYTHARRDYDIEIDGLKRETLRAQEEHERFVAVRDRLESDRVFVEEQLTKTKVRSVYSTV